MNDFRYQLEKYRGRGSRYVCPQCGRKYTFTRYIDTHNNNEYVNERVGKCNRLDKCGYHYTPKQFFEDNPWRRDCSCSSVHLHRKNEQMNMDKPQVTPQREPYGVIPRWFMERTVKKECTYKEWLRATFGNDTAERLINEYYIGGNDFGDAVFWQVDIDQRVRTGKIMNYDPTTGKRIRGSEAYVDWIHSIMQREGALPEGWRLEQCLYGEHLLTSRPRDIVAVAEGAKTAHVGAALLPEMVWLAVDSMLSISEERLSVLKGRSVIFFADEGRAYEEWSKRLSPIAHNVGFSYLLSEFMEHHAPMSGGDIGDIVTKGEDEVPF